MLNGNDKIKLVLNILNEFFIMCKRYPQRHHLIYVNVSSLKILEASVCQSSFQTFNQNLQPLLESPLDKNSCPAGTHPTVTVGTLGWENPVPVSQLPGKDTVTLFFKAK